MNVITPTFFPSSLPRLNYDYPFGGTVPVDEGYGVTSNRISSIADLTSIFTEQLFGTQRKTRWVTGSFTGADPKEALLSRLAEYIDLPDDWDGYGGKAASIEALRDSVRFLTQFPSTFPLPKPMISGAGVIGLYWEGNGGYASIDFDGSGYYCYIADIADEEGGEDKVPVAQTLPYRLAEVIAITADL